MNNGTWAQEDINSDTCTDGSEEYGVVIKVITVFSISPESSFPVSYNF